VSTSDRFQPVEEMILRYIRAGIPAVQLVVRQRGETVYHGAFGTLNPQQPDSTTDETSRFDMASVTKLFTSTTFMRLVGRGAVILDQPVSTVLPAFSGVRPVQAYEDPLSPGGLVTVDERGGEVDASMVTFRHLLSHSSGLPAWRPLFRQADADHARDMALRTFFSYQPGADTVYSDLGLILIGMAVEELSGLRLDKAVKQLVLDPLLLKHTGFIPLDESHTSQGFAATEWCDWRNRRVIGEVHDENAWRMNGIAGHAGIFSTAADLAAFGQVFLDSGAPLLDTSLVQQMTSLQFEKGDLRRGLGFQLRSPDIESSGYVFSDSAFGHTGFTGTSLWVDPSRQTVVALLSNEVYRGRKDRIVLPFRVDIHKRIVRALDTV